MNKLNNVAKSANSYIYYKCMCNAAYEWSAGATVASTFCFAQSIKSLHRAIYKVALLFNCSNSGARILVSRMPRVIQRTT